MSQVTMISPRRTRLGTLLRIAAFGACLTLPRIALAECGDGVWDEDEQCDDGNLIAGDGCSETCRVACTRVGEAATQHTCGHGQFGPFVQQPAQAYPGFVFTDVSSPHTYYTVTLSGEPDANRSGVIFWPNQDGAFAIYLKENYPLALYTSTGEEVPVALEHAITSCPTQGALGWVKVYDPLSLEVSYDLVIGPISEATASFAIEYLPSFRSVLYRDRDGDGFGGEVVASAWCEFVPGDWDAVSAGDDCNDDDTTVFPGAAEACDGNDSDCGWDSDVGQDQLCTASTLGGRCLEVAQATVCGCSEDSDCEARQICRAATRRCEEPDHGEGGAPAGSAGAPDGLGGESGATAESAGGAGDSGGEATAGASSGGSSGRGGAGSSGRSNGGTSGRLNASGGTSSTTGGRAGDGHAGNGAAGEGPAPTNASNGCGCRMGNHSGRGSLSGLLLFAIASLWCRRRLFLSGMLGMGVRGELMRRDDP